MRKAFVPIFTVLLFAAAFAVDANTIGLSIPSSVSSYPPEFNVVWDVNTTNTDWNYFVVSFTFSPISQSDGWYSVDFNTGLDYNTVVPADGPNCELNAEMNFLRCSLEFNTEKILRNGSVLVEVNGYDSDNNLIDSEANTVQISSFSEITASLASYDPPGELNVSVAFPCDVNASGTDVNGFIIHVSGQDLKPSTVYVDKNVVTLEFNGNVLSLVRGALLELNTADVNAPECNFAPDTNTLVLGLPDEYMTITSSGWQPFVIPHEINAEYKYTRDALNEVNAYIYFEGNHWVFQNPVDDNAYTLHSYFVYSDHNVYVPIRDFNSSPAACSNVDHIQLSAGWSLIPVYCTNGQPSCSDTNSTLYALSFVEFNASNAYVATHPFYAAIAEWNGDGFTPVTSFGSYTIQNGGAYWVWIPENWLQGGLRAYYYGRCVSPPGYP